MKCRHCGTEIEASKEPWVWRWQDVANMGQIGSSLCGVAVLFSGQLADQRHAPDLTPDAVREWLA